MAFIKTLRKMLKLDTLTDTSNYELERSLAKRKNEKKNGLIKDDSGGKIMTNFVELRVKTDSYLKMTTVKMKK